MRRISPASRTAAAFAVTPFLAALLISGGEPLTFLVAILIMGGVTVIFALPLFALLNARGWLQWPHALAAGMACGVLPGLAGGPLSSVLTLAALGGAIGLLFWWLGIFRNPLFPVVSARPPWEMAALIPLAVLWFWYVSEIRPGHVTARLIEAPVVNEENWYTAPVRLQLMDGKVVTATMGAFVPKVLTINSCFAVATRRDASLMERHYVVSYPLDRYNCIP